eukprot:CAMPEP_0205915762 /NCGR_PEP_ID=MMETSP1325-20131115/8082_1 /ASSEMBLY_ACC=CAM_ASM_000708 /TAXON_ID=236786 /ORGANISM="Florenciella sp., Strain RCC1007" /LENGTH=112 /DNA_ID=CAMNT_0053282977 /DNA_START=20 /DNA_END=358 /DNA_ORIENTATION=-
MPDITPNVSFDKVAREMRCKWSEDNDKASLVQCQEILEANLPAIKALDGFQSVNRVVCGGCKDFKIIVTLDAEKYGDWENSSFAPESVILDALAAVDGVSSIETQTFTFMEM